MNWIDTPDSSTIARFGYDEPSQTLTVEFRAGTSYQYFDIPSGLFEQMQAAPSKGAFLSQTIKGKYRYARM